jgi:hypothetical protein
MHFGERMIHDSCKFDVGFILVLVCGCIFEPTVGMHAEEPLG